MQASSMVIETEELTWFKAKLFQEKNSRTGGIPQHQYAH